MTRIETIARIAAKLSSLDDERVSAVAEIVDEMVAPDELPRQLTTSELMLIEQSKDDFKAGRTLSGEQYRAEMDTFMQGLRAKYPA